MSFVGARSPVTVDMDLLNQYINEVPHSFPCQSMEDCLTFFHAKNVHAPLESVTFYTSSSEQWPMATETNTTYMMFTVKGFTDYQFRYTITHPSENYIRQFGFLMPFDKPYDLAVTFFGIEPISSAYDPKFGRPLCEFKFREQLGVTFYELHANFIHVLPFYRLPVGLNSQPDVMAWSIEAAKIMDEFCWLNIDPGVSAHHVLRRALQRETILGEIVSYPTLSEEYKDMIAAIVSRL